jgi:hypothetical protein
MGFRFRVSGVSFQPKGQVSAQPLAEAAGLKPETFIQFLANITSEKPLSAPYRYDRLPWPAYPTSLTSERIFSMKTKEIC